MISDDKPLRIFCRSIAGRDLFYIQLIYFGDLKYFDFSTSLTYNLKNNTKANSLIQQIINANISEDERLLHIDKLIIYVQTIQGIEQYYFPDDLISIDGKYMEFYSHVISDVLLEVRFPDYTPFSQHQNAFYFDCCRQILEGEINKEQTIHVSKEHFEEVVKLNQRLADEYVEWLSPKAEYFIANFTDLKNYDIYMMGINSKVVLFFIRESP